jgi:hypothetical protein
VGLTEKVYKEMNLMKTLKKLVSRGCLTGEGSTVKEAKDSLSSLTDAALEGSYTPVLLSYNGQHAMVYRCPVGWSYSLLNLSENGKSAERCSVFVGTQWDCIQHAAFHIIQNGCDVQAIRSEADLPDWLEDCFRRSDLVSWCRWQRAAQFAQNTGEPDVHKWACDHHYDAQFA